MGLTPSNNFLELALKEGGKRSLDQLSEDRINQLHLLHRILKCLTPSGFENYKFEFLYGSYLCQVIHEIQVSRIGVDNINRHLDYYSMSQSLAIRLASKFEAHALLKLGISFQMSNYPKIFLKTIQRNDDIFRSNDLRERSVFALSILEEYINKIDYEKLSKLLGVRVATFDFIPQLSSSGNWKGDISVCRRFYTKNALYLSLYYDQYEWDKTFPDLFNHSRSAVYCGKPSVISRFIEYMSKIEMIYIEKSDINSLVRLLFDMPSKYLSKYPLEIPRFKIVSNNFANDLKCALRYWHNDQVISGRVVDIANMVSRVFAIDGLSKRSIENSLKPSTRMKFKEITESEFMGVCQILAS
ncbi:hypothetical protein [Marinoscillum sp.]|uniref:hypothetical protein n=1 Tax=Marinoscillum sp. TaxID=2024838 RepID=UPI003BA9AE1F